MKLLRSTGDVLVVCGAIGARAGTWGGGLLLVIVILAVEVEEEVGDILGVGKGGGVGGLVSGVVFAAGSRMLVGFVSFLARLDICERVEIMELVSS